MLGWETPAIEAAAEHLHRCHMSGGQLDLAGHLIVTPSARAGRLLLGALVGIAVARIRRG